MPLKRERAEDHFSTLRIPMGFLKTSPPFLLGGGTRKDFKMSETRTATPCMKKKTEKCRPDEFLITYLLGHPTRGVDGIAFAEVATEKGLTREEFWLQVLQRNFGQLLESDAEGQSMLDDIFSEALSQSVTVWDAEPTIELLLDRRIPGLFIQSGKVIDPLGHPATKELANREALSRIATALMDFTRADWAVCSISDGESEFLFPLLREVKAKGSSNGE